MTDEIPRGILFQVNPFFSVHNMVDSGYCNLIIFCKLVLGHLTRDIATTNLFYLLRSKLCSNTFRPILHCSMFTHIHLIFPMCRPSEV